MLALLERFFLSCQITGNIFAADVGCLCRVQTSMRSLRRVLDNLAMKVLQDSLLKIQQRLKLSAKLRLVVGGLDVVKEVLGWIEGDRCLLMKLPGKNP